MQNHAQARKNMVDCQLNTNGVIVPDVLAAFSEVPRELFVPAPYQDVAYIDTDMKLGKSGLFLMEPLVHARMVQALAPKPGDRVLNVGDAAGYTSAIFAQLGAEVFVPEAGMEEALLETARAAWQKLGFNRIETLKGDFTKAVAKSGPYDLIFLNGAVAGIPEELTAQLAPGGRLAAVVKPEGTPMGVIVLAEKLASGIVATRKLFDAATGYLPGYEPKPGFRF
jgi:protein-L-isoaspartate(D-aspartate) O-methyltransferase